MQYIFNLFKEYNYGKGAIMEDFISIYENNKSRIENFIEESISNIQVEKCMENKNFKKLFSTFPSLELIYIVNKKDKKQNSANIYRNKIKENACNQDRSYLVNKLDFKNKNLCFSSVYISSATKNRCITLSIEYKDVILFLDFNLISILEKLDIIERNKIFHTFTKVFYFIAGSSLALFSLFIIVYSLYSFSNDFIISSKFSLEMIFKPIVSLTLALAIFDLSKTILEQEVFFKSYSRNSNTEINMLTKFLITIIIALSIETLMLVFKIAISDYTQMIYALYLIIGVSLFIISLSLFIYLVNKKK